MPVVDYNAIEERVFTPVENGIYAARLTKGELNPAKSSDKFPYYNCEFTLDADEGRGVTKQKVWKVLSLSPQSLWAFKKDMLALGATPEDMAPGSSVDTDDVIASCLEAPCRLQLRKVSYPKNDGTQGEKNEIMDVLSVLPF